MAGMWEVANDDGELCFGSDGLTWRHDEATARELHATYGGNLVQHADYPHTPGHMYGCQACEGACHCDLPVRDETEVECLYEGQHNTLIADAQEIALTLAREAAADRESGE